MRVIRSVEQPSVALVGTFPPMRCGIATFTRDLADWLVWQDLTSGVNVVAVVDAARERVMFADPRVRFVAEKRDASDHVRAAMFLNNLGVEVVCLQHEYGIFGGECGENVLSFVRALRRPLVVTFHTVLPEPGKKQRKVIRALADSAVSCVVMAQLAVRILADVYGVDATKVSVIPHGTPQVDLRGASLAKRRLGLETRTVLSTFGLLSRGKGIEHGLRAVAALVPRYPGIVYLVLGATHPGVLQTEGESYRTYLGDLVRALGIGRHVRFVNRYLSAQELREYLLATDIYLTPYTSAQQITSGTLAYALSFGKAIVSTPYAYARELLGGGRGLLCRFNDAESLRDCLEEVLSRPSLAEEIRRRAYAYSRPMVWAEVAKAYALLFREVASGQAGAFTRALANPPEVTVTGDYA